MELNNLQLLDHVRSPFSGTAYDLMKDRESGRMLLVGQIEGGEKKIVFEEHK